MSSQDNKGIPFSQGPDGIGYRLLELPPELVSLLEGDNPPVLTLESSPTAGLLKAAGKTYSLRQKNTSNSLIILRPAEESSSAATVTSTTVSSSDADEPTSSAMSEPQPRIPEVGVRAIATVHETVELIPEAGPVPAAATTAKGKWHEKFGRGR